ncbi:uncharacterized protein LOC111087433 [Limulus polyphemus]|uniref:Uncharacterized protein LOC111087433 n=1 Tax=Limulus polyphemus TaxID=6850 RepID=A0ABM1T1I9_LIMPO|nr:uncharacterized protein LOC111087433 [Limulus polyphemus]
MSTESRKHTKVMITLIVLLYFSEALPAARERRSGISDSRLAEIETRLALSKPVAYGIFDPVKIGKRTFRRFQPPPGDFNNVDLVYAWLNMKNADYLKEPINVVKTPY